MGLIKQKERPFQEHGFSVYRRYVCLHSYPEPKIGPHLKVGETIEYRNEGICIGEYKYINTPIFRLVEWHEYRTFEQLFSVRYIQVSSYSNYWLVGDILEVDGFSMELDTLTPKLIGFKVGSHTIKLDNCIPLENYDQFKYRNVKKRFQTN